MPIQLNSLNIGGKNLHEKSNNIQVQGTMNTKRDSFINQHSNDSFESKINTYEENNEVKDELMITLNPQKFKYDLWSDERDK